MNPQIKEKRKMVNVEPISSKAKNRFVNIMDSFHACYVEDEKDDLLFLASINKKYFMWLPRTGNEHWKIVK
jgi:hypothetical protein